MTMLKIVPYTIQWPDEFHSKGIHHITTNSKNQWSLSKPTQQFTINIQHPRCCIQRFDISNNNTPIINLEFRDSDSNLTAVFSKQIEMFSTTDPEPKIHGVYKEEMKGRLVKPSNRIVITLKSTDERVLGLSYFLIYTDVKAGDQQKLEKKSEKTTVKPNTSQSEHNTIHLVDSDEERNIQKAIKLSLQESERQNKGEKLHKQKVVVQAKQQSDSIQRFQRQANSSRIYTSLKISKRLLRILDDVTPQWIEQEYAQELKKDIPIGRSIIKFCRQKVFKGVKFCVFLARRKDQTELIQSALRLGFDYSPQPVSECYIFCETKDILKDKLKTVRDIKILKPTYVQDCLDSWKALDFRNYILY